MLKMYLNMQNKLADFMKKEDGMETVQAIILVVIGVVLVSVLISIIGTSKDKGIFKALTDALKEAGLNLG